MSDTPKVISSVMRKARKEHSCCECHKAIVIGETYCDISGIWDKPERFKQCDDCSSLHHAASIHADSIGSDDGVCFGQVLDYYCNTFCRSKNPKEPLEIDIQDLANHVGCNTCTLQKKLTPLLQRYA